MTNSVNSTAAKAVRAAEAITGKRWCSHHYGETDINNGSMIQTRRGKRFCCFQCQERRKVRR